MIIKSKRVSFIYKILALIICIVGQILTLGLLSGEFKPSQFLFYTNQSNILCLICFIYSSILVYKSIRDESKPFIVNAKYKGAVVLAITVIMIIYWTMLNEQMDL